MNALVDHPADVRAARDSGALRRDRRPATTPRLSPPISLKPRWLGPHVAYTVAKHGMSLCALGYADAAYAVICRRAVAFDAYAYVPGATPEADMFVDHV